MGDVVTAVRLAPAAENAEPRKRLASAQDMLVESAIDAGNEPHRVFRRPSDLAQAAKACTSA